MTLILISVFRIECELSGPLVYGSRVRLLHYTTDSKVVASDIVDTSAVFAPMHRDSIASHVQLRRTTSIRRVTATPTLKLRKSLTSSSIHSVADVASESSKLHCIYMRRKNRHYKNFEDVWVVTSRYKLRLEGESIYEVLTYKHFV
jgi:hypothetical protein